MVVPRVVMPKGANVPEEWCVTKDGTHTVLVVPSWTTPKTYLVKIDNGTGQMECECPGFKFRGYCHHTSGLIWFCYKKSKSRGVQLTSMASYHKFDPKDLGRRQMTVYEALLKGPASNRVLSERMGWPINTVTPRVNELRGMGVVVEAGKEHDVVTNRDVFVWMALPGFVPKEIESWGDA